MKNDEDLQKELDDLSEEAREAAEKLCEIFRRFDAIDTGKPETDEEKQKRISFSMETDRRRAMILRRVLLEFGGFLFI